VYDLRVIFEVGGSRHFAAQLGDAERSARLFSRVPIFTHNRHTDNFFTPAE